MSCPGDGPPADNQTHVQRALSVAPADEQKGEPNPVAAPSAKTRTGDSVTAAATSASSLRAAGSSQKQKQRLDKKPHKKQLPPGTAPGQANWEYKRRMPKQRATAWPSSILSDPDVLSLDDEGRFVLCKVCHVHYAVHGGKKPKPVIMNSIFRTRAWEVHKERTNSHRMQKRALESSARPELHAPPSSPVVTQQQQDQAQQRQRQQQLQLQQALRQQQFQSRQQVPNHGNYVATEARHNTLQQSRNEAVAFHHMATRDADSAPHTPPAHPLPSLQRVQSEGKANESSAQSRAPMLANNLMSEQDLRRRVSGNERLFIRPAGIVSVPGGKKHAAPVLSEEHSQEGWTSGSKDSSLSQQPDQGQSNDSNGENPPAQPNDAEPPPPPPPNDDSESSPPLPHESDSKQKERSRKRRARERDEESESSKEEAIEASSRAMRDQYWRTMREVYSLSRVKRGSGGSGVRSSSKDLARKKKKKKRSAENGKSTNREDMGDNPLRTMIVHDPTLINAIDRLAGVLSKQLSEMRSTDTSATRHFMSTLTTEVSEMRRQQEHAMERMIDLGERHLKVMEEILQCKLRKEQRALDGPRVSSNSAQHRQQQQSSSRDELL